MSLFCLIVLLCVGCNRHSSKEDIDTFLKKIYEKSTIKSDKLVELKQYQPSVFSPSINRNPFSFSSDQMENIHCSPPEKIPELELFNNQPLANLVLRGVIGEGGEYWALVMDTNHTLHRVSKGQVIGVNRGLVEFIDAKKMLITEYVQNKAGCWRTHEKILEMAS